ncbi:MAG TPA: exodeoxyribonuclease VII large subunit, partial [Alphaproteobacteria bacterium]|nr:exodeoxyribonuclease VII large subunit [Alphaproteobacteria bacterium]
MRQRFYQGWGGKLQLPRMDSESTPRRAELSVSELTRLVKGLVEGEPALAQVWVRGEASNVRLISSGHLYFTLKDENAELRVAYFAYAKRRRKPPADGEALLVHGDMRVYERRGEYQLVADDLVAAGKGDLAARFEALKQKLSDEGLFAEERKLAPPAVPRRVGIVTGAATAALQDVLNVLRRRAPYAGVVLFPASVQGDSAPPEIAAALQAADACPGIEVILLIRGGGSIEDLWCFNDEKLARALAEIRRPVITGVGHEIDFTIADFAADARAPTPSGAAELVAPDRRALLEALARTAARIGATMSRELRAAAARFDAAGARASAVH